VLGSDGQKMSKSLRNYPDVSEVFERDGADAMRWFLMSSPVIRGGNLIVTEEGIREGVRQFLLPLWSTYYFFSLYAGEHTPTWRTDSTHLLDRYLIAKMRDTIDEVTTHLENLDSPLAAASIRDFADVLTNWYVRRSRDRFWSGDDTDAVDTLYTVLETLCRIAAPLAPLITEEVWRGLTGGESVHLTDWPDAKQFGSDDALVAQMDLVREIARAGLSLRKAHQLRVRLPLSQLTVVVDDPGAIENYREIIADELNVKSVECVQRTDDTNERFGVTSRVVVNARAVGPRLGKDVQSVIAATKSGDYEITAEGVVAAGHTLVEGEYELALEVADESRAVEFIGSSGFVLLHTDVTEELEREGLARDIIRAIQQERKNIGLDVSDRISLTLDGDDAVAQAFDAHRELITSETLATEAQLGDVSGDDVAVGNTCVRVGIAKVS